MKKTVRITRANFPSIGNYSWMNFFVEILRKKYDVIIDAINPDIVIYTNQYYTPNVMDEYTNEIVKGIDDYDDSVIKVFISGEACPNFMSHINKGENYYALGYEHINHERYLRFPTYVLDAFVLHNEGGMFNDPYSWITDKKNPEEIMSKHKHFCSVVQSSNNPDRGKFFDLMIEKYYVKSSGPWRKTIKEEDSLNPYKYHDYSNKNYLGRIDGLTYRDKVIFFSDCTFNLSFQYTNTDYLTQEKIIHAFAANTIPIFFGNRFI